MLSANNNTAGSASINYVDAADFLNLEPKVGVLSDNTVPVYVDFKVGSIQPGSTAFAWTDNSGKQVVFYHSRTPTGVTSVFRAYRFSETSEYIFDNTAIKTAFLLPGEYVSYIHNMGTFFAVLDIRTDDITRTRTVIAKTHGSSNWEDWELFVDVTQLVQPRCNFFVLFDLAGDRIIRSNTSLDSNISIDVYSLGSTFNLLPYFNLLRSLAVVSTTDITTIDQKPNRPVATLGFNKRVHRTDASLNYAYFSPNDAGTLSVFGNPFTWNSITEKLLIKNTISSTYSIVEIQNSPFNEVTIDYSVSTIASLTVNWSIPKSWLLTGAGTPANNIPLKPSGYRYHKIQDDTWETAEGGISLWPNNRTGFSAAAVTSVVTDEYTGKINVVVKGTYDNASFDVNRFGIPFSTLTLGGTSFEASIENAPLDLGGRVFAPDAYPWDKSIGAEYSQIVDNHIMFTGHSGINHTAKVIDAEFSNNFASKGGNANDTLRLNASTWRSETEQQPLVVPSVIANNFLPGYFGTVAKASGSAVAFWAKPGEQVFTISVADNTRSYAAVNATLPVLPKSIGTAFINEATSPITFSGTQAVAWNGLIGVGAVFWVTCAAKTDHMHAPRNNSFRLAKFTAATSTWTISRPLFTTELDLAATNRGEIVGISPDMWRINGHICLSESGKILIAFSVPTAEATLCYAAAVDGTTLEAISSPELIHSKFTQSPTAYSAAASTQDHGTSFGYSSKFGYYAAIPSGDGYNLRLVSSLDATGINNLTESEWWNHPIRNEKYLSILTEAGLTAYFSSYPIFLGGYYSDIPSDQPIALEKNTITHIYATRDVTSRGKIVLSSSTDCVEDSFSRVRLATVTTDDETIISSVSHAIGVDSSTLQSKIDKKLSISGGVLTGPLMLSPSTNPSTNEAVTALHTELEIEKSVHLGLLGQLPFISKDGTRVTEQDHILKIGQFVENSVELSEAQMRIVDMDTMFSKWKRFSHANNKEIFAGKVGTTVTFVMPAVYSQAFSVGDSGIRIDGFTHPGYNTPSAVITSESTSANLVKFTYQNLPPVASQGIYSVSASRTNNTITVNISPETTSALGLRKGSKVALVDMTHASINGFFTVESIGQTTLTIGLVGPDIISATGSLFVHEGVIAFDDMQPAMPQEIKSWELDTTSYAIKSALNSLSHIGFVSDEKYSAYVHEVEVTSTSAEDQSLGVIIASAIDLEGREHTLTAIRSSGSSPWKIVYDLGRSTEWIVADKSTQVMWGNGAYGGDAEAAGYPGSGYGWMSTTLSQQRQAHIKITRDEDIIIANTSDLTVVGAPAQYIDNETYNANIVIDLNSDARLSQFKGPRSYGYSCKSQNSAIFNVKYFSHNVNAIYRTDTNQVFEYNGKAWAVSSASITSQIGTGRLLFNENTNKLFFSAPNGNIIKLSGFEELPLFEVVTSKDAAPIELSLLANSKFYRVDSVPPGAVTFHLSNSPITGTVIVVDNNYETPFTIGSIGAVVTRVAGQQGAGPFTVAAYGRVTCHKTGDNLWKLEGNVE